MSLLSAAVAQAETAAPLPIPSWGFGVIAGSVFVILLIITWSFRDVANRHSHKAAPDAAAHAGAPGAAHHGAGHPSQPEH